MSTQGGANPLLDLTFPVPFDCIRAEHVEPAIGKLLQDARGRLESIAATGGHTFADTLLPLDRMTEALDTAMSVVKHLESVTTYPELRAAFNVVEPPVSEFHSSIPLNEGLWRAIREYSETGEAKRLDGVRKRFLTKTIQDFRRHGAELDAAGKARLREIDVELTKLTTRFSENTLDSTNAFEYLITDPALLKGLPQSAIDAARDSAARKGREGWRFTLQAPSYTAVMMYLDDGSIRRHIYDAFVTRATEGEKDNRPLIARILDLRRQKAALLGFSNFADLVLEDRMAQNGERARKFLDELREKTEAQFESENRDLLAFRRELEGAAAPELQPWDVAYYAEKQRAAKYAFDEEELRPYFPLERVVEGMFDVVRRLYGIRVVAKSGVPVWDPGVRFYEIHDDDGTLLGSFYTDWFPRENKRGGAWMDAFYTGLPGAPEERPHVGVICGNLTPPVSGKPSLLTHREVETIFHEFGHLLHHCLSRVEVRSLAGTHVAWDFVELPSQIMENWCWEREALDLFAHHYQTGEPIPDDLFRKMKRARNFRSANAQMRQLGFGTLDLAMHTQYSEADGDVMEWARRMQQQFAPAELPPYYAMIAGFTHLFGDPVGYGAGYYSYKWAEVLDADAFTRFRENGIFSPEVGGRFREIILSRGDSRDPAELYREFMGRDPDLNALLERSGLKPADATAS